jgi:hypothetical protein
MAYLREMQAYAHQNQIVKGVDYRLNVSPFGTTLKINFPAGSGKAGSTVARMIIKQIQSDWFNCLFYDKDGQHPSVEEFGSGEADESDYIKVAKPWELRFTDWDGQTVDGITFSYAGEDLNWARRKATQGSITEFQIVVRPWYIGEIILAVSKIKGGTDATDDGPADDGVDPADIEWEDLNTTSHAWAQTDQTDPGDSEL